MCWGPAWSEYNCCCNNQKRWKIGEILRQNSHTVLSIHNSCLVEIGILTIDTHHSDLQPPPGTMIYRILYCSFTEVTSGEPLSLRLSKKKHKTKLTFHRFVYSFEAKSWSAPFSCATAIGFFILSHLQISINFIANISKLLLFFWSQQCLAYLAPLQLAVQPPVWSQNVAKRFRDSYPQKFSILLIFIAQCTNHQWQCPCLRKGSKKKYSQVQWSNGLFYQIPLQAGTAS